ncbi:hypothetical protein DJ81_10440 [Halorubrum sp. Hd13]|nr:hypothetical protein DJ81_10440 [Halorubrum sp. Hd13]
MTIQSGQFAVKLAHAFIQDTRRIERLLLAAHNQQNSSSYTTCTHMTRIHSRQMRICFNHLILFGRVR